MLQYDWLMPFNPNVTNSISSSFSHTKFYTGRVGVHWHCCSRSSQLTRLLDYFFHSAKCWQIMDAKGQILDSESHILLFLWYVFNTSKIGKYLLKLYCSNSKDSLSQKYDFLWFKISIAITIGVREKVTTFGNHFSYESVCLICGWFWQTSDWVFFRKTF